MKPRIIVLVIVLLAALGGGAYWLYLNVERYTRLENTGPILNVLINPWHAAQAFLKQQNIESHRAMDLHDVLHQLNPDDALVLFNDSALYDSSQQQQLMEWMQQGGHLVITANYEWDDEEESSEDPFLDAIGVRMIWLDEENEESDSDEEKFDLPESTDEDLAPVPDEDVTPLDDIAKQLEDATGIVPPDTADDGEPMTRACGIYSDADIFRVAYDENAEPLQINFGYAYTLEDASGRVLRTADAYPNGLLQYTVGKGRMTVLLETDIWTNSTIDDFDHAFLLWHLVGDRPKVWLVASHDAENLMDLIWRNARYLLIGIVTLLILWGWRKWVRFGPLIPDPSPARRQLLEHIEASTRFRWQHQQHEPLLQQLRDDIWLHLNRHHGIDHQQGDNSQAALKKLAELSQQPVTMVHDAMTCPAPQREAHWVDLISQLQTIRNAL